MVYGHSLTILEILFLLHATEVFFYVSNVFNRDILLKVCEVALCIVYSSVLSDYQKHIK